MLKRFVHLVTGMALLAVSAYFFAGLVHVWKPFWRQELSSKVRHTKSGTGSDDRNPGALKPKVYGVPSPNGESGDEDEAATLPESGVALAPFEHVTGVNSYAPSHFLHKRFPVKTYQGFEFVLPPHSLHPRLQGKFRAVGADGNAGGSAVELLLMDDEEFADFVGNRAGSTTFSEDASSSRAVIWGLSQTFAEPQKYYLVFRNVSAPLRQTTVDADFTASFD